MARALSRLLVGLEAVAHRTQQVGDDPVADLVPLGRERASEAAGAQSDPAQRAPRVAARHGIDQPPQRVAKPGVPGLP